MIRIYDKFDSDFTGNGLRVLEPLDCTVREALNGSYELTLVYALSDFRADAIALGNVIVAPVPACDTPPMDVDSEAASSARIYEVDNGGKRLALYTGTGKKKKVVAWCLDGSLVILVSRKNKSWFRVITPEGAGGYMAAGKLKYLRTESVPARKAAVLAPKPVRDQPFEINEIEPGTDTVTVHARHYSYKLAKNRIKPVYATRKTRQQAADMIMAACVNKDHEFALYCEDGDAASMELSEVMSPLQAILGDGGLVDTWGGELLRDWCDLYIADRIGEDRGVRIAYGRNLTSLGGKLHTDNLATRIMPIGTTKDGKDLYLPELFVDSPHIDEWPDPEIVELRVKEADASIMSVAEAYTAMRKAARETLDNGADQPEASLNIGHIDLSTAERYRQFRELQRVSLGDTVHCDLGPMGIVAEQRVVGYEYDCKLRRYRSVTLGALGDTVASVGISPKQLPAAGITAIHLSTGAATSRILAESSVRSVHIDSAAIQRAHIAQACIDDLNSLAIAALTATINAITAGDISTNTLSAAFAHLMQVVADNIQAGTVTADALDAVMASIVSISVGAATFDLAEIQNLLASALVLDEGQAGSMHITNLAVTSANLLNATIGKLVIKGDDGGYYEVGVGSDGVIRTAQYDATAQEIADGRTTDGRQIVTETINAEAITGETVKAQEAVLNRVLTAALTAGQITANDAMLASASIPLLYTTSIQALGNSLDLSANQTIQLLVGVADSVRRWFTFGDDGLRTRKAGSKWSTLIDDVGYHIDHDDVNGHVGSFHKERLTVHGVQIGDIVVRPTGINHTGGWAWVDA